jgi:hypothetical protein
MKRLFKIILGVLVIAIGMALVAFSIFSLWQPIGWDLKGMGIIAGIAGICVVFVGGEIIRDKNIFDLVKDALNHI